MIRLRGIFTIVACIACICATLLAVLNNKDIALIILAIGISPALLIYIVNSIKTGKAGGKYPVDADVKTMPVIYWAHVAMAFLWLFLCVGYLAYRLLVYLGYFGVSRFTDSLRQDMLHWLSVLVY